MNLSADSSSHSKAEQFALQFLSRVWAPPHDLSAIDELMTEDLVITSGGIYATRCRPVIINSNW